MGNEVLEKMESEEITIKFEAQLVSTSMTANGGHKVTLRLNPEDVLDTPNLGHDRRNQNERVRSLMTQSPNTRYVCVLVQLGQEDDLPVVQKDAKEVDEAIAKFSMLCRTNHSFWNWLDVGSEAAAVDRLKAMLDINSRTELRSKPEALKLFKQLMERFYNE